MSWIVEHLLRNSDAIRSSQLESPDLDADDYNNLLVIERKIDDLYELGILSDMDLFIIDSISNGVIMDGLVKSLPKRRILSRTFSQICERIGYFLGGYFTDEGFIENLKENYTLTEENLEVIKEYMSGRYRHKLIRRPKSNG